VTDERSNAVNKGKKPEKPPVTDKKRETLRPWLVDVSLDHLR
jgi:hypothetical protein